jgi:hypothetical protein
MNMVFTDFVCDNCYDRKEQIENAIGPPKGWIMLNFRPDAQQQHLTGPLLMCDSCSGKILQPLIGAGKKRIVKPVRLT